MKYRTLFILFFIVHSLCAKEIYVSPVGKDSNSGTKESPFASFERAVEETKRYAAREAVTVWFSQGTYYLNQTLVLGSKFTGTADKPILFAALPGAEVIVKGSRLLSDLHWKEYQKGLFVTTIPSSLHFDQLYVDGERQVRARFPNQDYQNPIRGGKGYQQVVDGSNRRFDKWFTFNPALFSTKNWQNPETGIVHAFQSHNWGNMQYRIKDIDRKEHKILLGEGGWQLQRAFGIGQHTAFYIDNIFEELDAPGEWFLDHKTNQLYYYPPAGILLEQAKVEVPVIKDLIQLKGTSSHPVKSIVFKGFHFTQSMTTFMDQYEPVSRGDWAIHRGGAIFMEGAERCAVENCDFESLGGNGIFMSGYNRANSVRNCRFIHTGESAVCFVGSPSAVRCYSTWDDREIKGKSWMEMRKDMDLEAGPKSPDYPEDCIVENCIMHDFGDFGKQVAGVYISMSHRISASHNTIYNCPRAGICINDGTWGGHVIEYCNIWETVRETGEHGPFNSWGRERQWLGGSGSDQDFKKELTLLDAIDVTTIRNNRIANFRKSVSAGNWTIDLDDGSSNYDIYNNLNLGSTIKLRDGVLRKVHNNITVSAVPLGWHVWPKDSKNEIYQNIFVISGAVPGKGKPTKQFVRPIGLPKTTTWSNHYDQNLYWNINFQKTPEMIKGIDMTAWKAKGYDCASKIADPLFVNPQKGDYKVKANSPALKLGFTNFPMDKFGHYMTRIVPFGGDFSSETTVVLVADKRMTTGGTVRYTLDGTEPTLHSPIYTHPFKLNRSTVVKARSFDAAGHFIDFVHEVRFKKVPKVIYPNWYSTLLTGKYIAETEVETELKAKQELICGAVMVNIGDDPDLIDASGGHNAGCYIKSIAAQKGMMWSEAGLARGWIIQKVNDIPVNDIKDLNMLLDRYKGETVEITAVKSYDTQSFKVIIPRNYRVAL